MKSAILFICLVIAVLHIISLSDLLKYRAIIKNIEYVSYVYTEYNGNHIFHLSKNDEKLCKITLEPKGDFRVLDEINNEVYIHPIGYIFHNYHIRKKLLEKVPKEKRNIKIKKENFTNYL